MYDPKYTRGALVRVSTHLQAAQGGDEVETVAPTSCAKQELLAKKIDSGALVVVLADYGNLLENLEAF